MEVRSRHFEPGLLRLNDRRAFEGQPMAANICTTVTGEGPLICQTVWRIKDVDPATPGLPFPLLVSQAGERDEASLHAGLLPQFALCRCLRRFLRLDGAGGKLDHEAALVQRVIEHEDLGQRIARPQTDCCDFTDS